MGAEDNVQDPRVRALRAAGENRAADILEALAEADQQQRQQREREPEPRIPLLSGDIGVDRQALAEAEVVGEALRRSGVNRWMSAGPLLGGPEGGR